MMKMFTMIALFSSVASAASPAMAQSGDWRDATFTAIYDNYTSSLGNQFSEPKAVPPPHNGTIIIPFTDGSASGVIPKSDAFFSYEDGALSLLLSPESIGSEYDGTYRDTIAIHTLLQRKKSYVGQNAFGVSAKITPYWNNSGSIAYVKAPQGMMSPYQNPAYLKYFSERSIKNLSKTYWVKIKTSPRDAKIIAANATVALTVTFPDEDTTKSAQDAQKNPQCKPAYFGATLKSPTEVYEANCNIEGEISRIQFIRKDTGEVLANFE